MMDPLSITVGAVSLSAACFKLSTWLYKWIDETKSSDEIVKTFANELKTLSMVLDAVKTTSQNRPTAPTSNIEHDEALWGLVQSIIDDCSVATRKLEKLLEGIGSRKGIGLTITNFHLNLQSDKMSRLRGQLQNHKNELQITMQAINLNLTMHNNASNMTALTNLSLKVDTLLRFVNRAETANKQKRQAALTAVDTAPAADEEEDEEIENLSILRLEQCTQLARAVASSASSVLAEEASTTHGGTEEVHRALGSEYGDPLDDSHRVRIEGWIPALTISEEGGEDAVFSSEGQGSSLRAGSIFSQEDESETTILTELDSLTQVGSPGPDGDFDTNQDLELFQVFFRKANSSYDQKKYGESERYYLKALERCEKAKTGESINGIRKKIGLAAFEQEKWSEAHQHFNLIPGSENLFAEMSLEAGTRRSEYGEYSQACEYFERAIASPGNLPSQTLRDIHGQAGIAYYRLENWTESALHFHSVTDVQDDVPDLRSLEAEHYLAVICLRKGESASAEHHAMIASNGRRRILGRAHDSWKDSIALLAEIYEVRDDPVEAEGYRSLLPEGFTSRYHRESRFTYLFSEYIFNRGSTRANAPPPRASREARKSGSDEQAPSMALRVAVDEILEFMRTTYKDDLQKSAYFVEEFWEEIRDALTLRAINRNPSRPCFTLLHLLTLLGLDPEIRAFQKGYGERVFQVSAKDSRSLTPFRLAVQTGNLPLISLFLSRPEFNREKESSRVLHDLAILLPTRDAFKFLVSRNLIDINEKMGIARNTPLMLACQRADIPVVQFLLSQEGLKINAENARDETVLLVAAASGSYEIMELLLAKADINVNTKSTLGETALSTARTHGNERIIQLLKSRGAEDQPRVPVTLLPPDSGTTDNRTLIDPPLDNTLVDTQPLQRPRSARRPTIRLVPHADAKVAKKSTLRFFRDSSAPSHPSLSFNPISRILPHEDAVITLGRYSESGGHDLNPAPNEPSAAPIGFKTKVVSRQHCQLSYMNGQWYVKDVSSSSGTFLNGTRLSPMNKESPRYHVTDGDILQLGTDFRGGEELTFRRVKAKVEIMS